MTTLFYDDNPLESFLRDATPSIFLAGPTARGVRRTPWRAAALTQIQQQADECTVILPEFRDSLFADSVSRVFATGVSPIREMKITSYNVLRWETTGIERAAVVLFWMPFHVGDKRDPGSLPGFTTRAEVGRELARAPQRLVLGMPPGTSSSGHIRYHAYQAGVRIWDTLEQTVEAAVLASTHRA